MDYSQRTIMVVGEKPYENVVDKTICIVGIGGVGGAALEGLVRFGIKNIVVIDFDRVDITNLNRQIISTQNVVGEKKVEVAEQRAKAINPYINITNYPIFINKDNVSIIKDINPDYVIDAIDSVSSKLDLIEFCFKNNIPIVSSMGTGNRLNVKGFVIDTVEKTISNGCGLSKVMRHELKKRGLVGHISLYNINPPQSKTVNSQNGRNAPGSCPFAPNIAGLMLAEYVVSKLL